MQVAMDSQNELREDQIPALLPTSTVADVPDTHFKNTYTIELLTGSAVIELLQKPEFQKSLDALFETCTWATVFQGRPYITAWYQVYCNKHLPVLVIAVENGQLAGVLPMALLDTQPGDRPKKGKRITGAGHYDAEYQSWLAVPAYGESFIKDALAKLLKMFPGHPITFRYLPPGTPLHWLKNDKIWRRYGTLQTYTRPLINLDQPDHAKLLKSRQFRNKLNRLKRLGEVQLECITDIASFKTILDELAILYDFRFSALFNKHHFRDDPARKELLLELFRRQLLHVTILKVNGKTFAGVVGVSGNEWVYLSGFSCHSPFEARAYSPGLLHFSFLAKKLHEEKRQYFDLTPGYDSYKDKLANQHDEVHELMVSNDPLYQIKKRVRKYIHTRLLAAGIRPMTAELTYRKFFYRLRHLSIRALIKKMGKGLQKEAVARRYVIPANELMPGATIALEKDNLDHLLQFRAEKGTGITRWDFVANAMFRLETGQHCFTWVENDRLLTCAWFTFPKADENNEAANSNAIELKNLYCHAAGKNHLQFFLYSVIAAVVKEGRGQVLISNDQVFNLALEAVGFQQE
ncbi:GNAT family N-acetyltransferase [Longitalea arenae]|uniref:GNAT family N-acetyltransferase n=1 Tax=Longitalea arenae TaxID=2812558 RepID=UPI001967D1CF|nr:GNAT family N-acetyltransferase [Longitalea arenae]